MVFPAPYVSAYIVPRKQRLRLNAQMVSSSSLPRLHEGRAATGGSFIFLSCAGTPPPEVWGVLQPRYVGHQRSAAAKTLPNRQPWQPSQSQKGIQATLGVVAFQQQVLFLSRAGAAQLARV